jgi:hypothetical protein
MSKRTNPNNYGLRSEYDLSKTMVVPKGRYAPNRRAGKNVVVLEPDVARAFPTDQTVNEALRLIMEISKIPSKRKSKSMRPSKVRTTTSAHLPTRTTT